MTVPVPFDPDEAWGAKPRHHVAGTIGGCDVRGVVETAPAATRSCSGRRGIEIGASPTVPPSRSRSTPKEPQRGDLAPDIAAALDAAPEAGAFFDSLAQFYRNAYLRWIEATKRRPDQRPVRIAEVVRLLEDHQKQRPDTPTSE